MVSNFGGVFVGNEKFSENECYLNFLVTKESGTVIKVSKEFLTLTEHKFDNVLNHNIIEVFKNLRVGPNININNIDEKTDYFLFTKSFKVKFINIKVIYEKEQRKYIFLEKPKYNLELKYPFVNALLLDNYYGIAIYSIPDITLLEANERYLGFKDENFNMKENCIGKHISEFTTGFKGSKYEDILNTVLKTGKSYNIEECKYDGFKRGVTYWGLSLTPLYEDDKMKYCVVMTTEVTEQVLNRKRLEEQARIIKEQNCKLKRQADLLNLSKEAIFVRDLKGSIIYWNKGAEEIYGYSNKEVIGHISDDLLKTSYLEKFGANKLIILKDGIWSGEVEHTRKDGTKLIIETSHQIFIDEDGRRIILEINRDITERKKLEMEAVHQKEVLEEIIQSIDDALFIYDADKNYYLTNKAAKEYYRGNELKKFGDYYNNYKYYDLSGKEIPLENMIISKVFRGEVVKNERLTLKNNNSVKYVNVNGRPIYDSNGKIKFAVLCGRDITHDIENQIMIEKQKEQLKAILDNMQESIYVFDSDGKYFIKNRMAESRFKIISDSIYRSHEGVEFFTLDGEKIKSEDMPHFRIRDGEYINDYIMHIKFEGKEEYISISGTPVFDKEGNFIYGIICGRNVTDFIKNEETIKEIQLKILRAERERNETLEKSLEMKDEFLSLISHEFKTPLNVMNTAIQAIDYFCCSELSDKLKKYLGMIKLNTFRQLRLVNNLLDITRANDGRIKINKKNIDIVFLTNAITESVYTYASQKGVNLVFESEFNEKVIGIDDEKYERILLNLLSNAIKFTPEGKSITVRLASKNKCISIEVKDRGIGIPKDKAEVIFERFGQVNSSLSRQAEGTGIGLSLVKKFVEALGGSISLKSKVGIGSTFTILLPSERIVEEHKEKEIVDFLGNHLVQSISVEFSDIYL